MSKKWLVIIFIVFSAIFTAGCVRSDLQDPVGQIRRLVNRYTAAIFPKRVALPVPRPAQNSDTTGSESGEDPSAALILQQNLSTGSSNAEVYIKAALDEVTERTQQLSLETLMLDKSWDGIIFYCRYYNSGTDATGIGSLTTTTNPSNTTRTNNWTNCIVPEGAINAEIDQDLIAAVQEAMGGDDISAADKAELQKLDGKNVNLQEMKITRYFSGSTITDASSGTDIGYAYRVEYNYSDASNKRIMRFNSAKTKMDLVDYETHTDSDGKKFESKSHFNTVQESATSGKQISQLFMYIKEGDENYIANITMQQWDEKASTNGLYVTVAFEQNGKDGNINSFAQGVVDDSGGFARAKVSSATADIANYGAIPADGFYLLAKQTTATTIDATCSVDWDDVIGTVTISGGAETAQSYWGNQTGPAATTLDFCLTTFDEDGNIATSILKKNNQSIDINSYTQGTITTYSELFDASGNVTSQTSDGSANATMQASEYYTAYAAVDGGNQLSYSDDVNISISGVFTTTKSGDFVVVSGTTCPSTNATTWFDDALGYGKYKGGSGNSDAATASFYTIYWGDSSFLNSTSANTLCNLEIAANGDLTFTVNNGGVPFINSP